MRYNGLKESFTFSVEMIIYLHTLLLLHGVTVIYQEGTQDLFICSRLHP